MTIDKRKHYFTFICSLHGEQEFDAVIFAGIKLKCGCKMVDFTSEFRFETKEGSASCLEKTAKEVSGNR